MALTPEGTPYVESSDLVANYPAASLSLANRVDLVGVLPFASAAARTTAIPSPTDGQYSYLQDTNLTQFYNGSAWQTAGMTPGLNLVTPTSIANSGGSASLSGGQITFSGVSSVSFNGVFTTTYDNYFMIYRSITFSATDETIRCRLRNAGADYTGTAYSSNTLRASSGAVSSASNPPGNTQWDMAQVTTPQQDRTIFVATIMSPKIATKTVGFSDSYGIFAGATNQIHYNNLTQEEGSYDGFSLYPQSGTFGGILRIYGYQNS